MTRAGFAAYCFSPDIGGRLGALRRRSGLSYTVAALLVSARVLPAWSEVLRRPRYSTREVIAAAFYHCPASWQYADRVAFLLALCAALLLFGLLGGALLLSVLVPVAAAAEPSTGGIAGELLASVFGSPDIFGGASAFASSPLHAALYGMLAVYSKTLMIVASFIVVYFVVSVVGEAAQSGQPFGRRFNSLYAPLRLVFALGLLVPLGAGLNAAQYVTLYTAHYGSQLADEAWQVFERKANDASDMPSPAVPEVGPPSRGRCFFQKSARPRST